MKFRARAMPRKQKIESACEYLTPQLTNLGCTSSARRHRFILVAVQNDVTENVERDRNASEIGAHSKTTSSSDYSSSVPSDPRTQFHQVTQAVSSASPARPADCSASRFARKAASSYARRDCSAGPYH